MKKRKLQAVSIILSIMLMGQTALISFAEETTASSTTETESSTSDARTQAEQALADAQAEKEELESALADAEALVSSLKSSKSSAQEKVNSLNGQLATISAQISDLESQLDSLETKIADANIDLQDAENEAANQYEAMKLRIKYIYENGNDSYVTMILSAKSISSLINAIEYVTMLSDYDRNMLDEYLATIDYIEETKASLEAEYDTAQTMRDEIGVQKQTVQVLKDAKSEELEEIGDDLEDAEEVAEAYEQEVKAQNEILATIQAQIAAMDQGEETTYISSGIFAWPCPGYKYVSSDYGPRTAPTSGASSNHKGIDLAAPYGTAILAAEAGVVTKAAYSSSGGNYIIINHGADSSGAIVCTVYMHCSSLYVSEGDIVSRGQTIAAVGSTGVSTGNHLHFAVTVNGSYVSPWGYVSQP